MVFTIYLSLRCANRVSSHVVQLELKYVEDYAYEGLKFDRSKQGDHIEDSALVGNLKTTKGVTGDVSESGL